ncbi:hypothetical protein M407DRAFT_23744 [Tulasnella calospora MUT 4182]|uniref:Mid2 domain-containing protein n=1 Tax=Tulasnella calospora MUT 4182 TaxID=1051891 RepID=A0A0C3QJ59_9AGAM|nr:hypothetical protein M407DRAFT_23744 [Tulasnella calospora MUT 4182]
MAQSRTTKKTTTSSNPMTRSMTSSLPSIMSLSTSSNVPSPTTSESIGPRSRKSIGVAGVIGIILAIAVLVVIGVVWRKHRQHKAVKARMLARSQTTIEQTAMPLKAQGAFQRSTYISLNRGGNLPSESSAQLVQTDDHELHQGSQDSEQIQAQKHYQPTSGYSYPGERLW